MPKRKIALILLAIVSSFILLHFATTKYPTHSDVFWYGVIVGFLATVFLMFLALIGVLAYRLNKKQKEDN